MGNNSNGQRDRLRGVQHPPEADIQNIRELLRGYGSENGVLKELIQNAEDAEARHLDLILTPGDPAAANPLLRTSGLCAVNDGVFKTKDLQAIFRLGLGTKGIDPRAIGRFGKGLKTVFSLCEAFFVVARADREKGWERDEVCEFFNPWHGWRHTDWDETFDSGIDEVFSYVSRSVVAFGEESPHWLAFWLPLRHPDHQRDDRGVVAWIHENTGGMLPSMNAQLGDALAVELNNLAPSLVTLRHLQRIRLIDDSGGEHKETEWFRVEGSDRVTEPGGVREPELLKGAMIVQNPVGQQVIMKYTGYAGTLPERFIAQTKANNGWPNIVDMTESASSADQKAKGEPHFATILTATPDEKGKLEVRWSVFFPVGEQPQGTQEVILARLARKITLNLHGFFFLDTERRRVDGLQQHFENSNHPCLEWNQIVAKEGTLAHLPKAVAAFAAEQGLDDDQCRDLADALRDTWVWEKFQTAICRNESWRPRWHSGVETWESISAETDALLIPHISKPDEILTRIPSLETISEEHTLIAKAADGTLPGLYVCESGHWPEALVLRLLENVSLGSTADEATANWINRFLDHLQEQNTLTPSIREQADLLPLLMVRDVCANAYRRITSSEWVDFVMGSQLFTTDQQTGGLWLRLLCAALPEWRCAVADTIPPRWFNATRAPICNETKAAEIVLMEPGIGAFSHRVELFKAFAALANRNPQIRLAMRYLIHGKASHASDGESRLFIASTMAGQRIWIRLIEQLLEKDGGADSWRILPSEWAAELSPQIQQDLGISTVDARGALEELIKGQIELQALEFAPDQWSDNDISALMQGLFQAGQHRQNETLALLRKLRLHKLRGRPDERVSVADGDGRLGEHFVLGTADIEMDMPSELQPLWKVFLAEAKVVERLAANSPASVVQTQLFQDAQLNWNYVVRRCLESSDPSKWARVILQAFAKQGDTAVAGLVDKLKTRKWLPLKFGESIAPVSIVHIDGIEDDFHRLLDPAKDGLAGIWSLPDWVQTHRGFATLRKYLPDIKEALELLGLWLADKPDWRLGLNSEMLPRDLGSLLSQLVEIGNLPAAALLKKLLQVRIRGYDDGLNPLLLECIFPVLSKPFDYEKGGLERIERILLSLQRRQDRTAFDAYLSQACKDDVLEMILPKLSLVNQRGQWISARKLIWPSENLNPEAQLCDEQAKILAPFHQSASRIFHQPAETLPGAAGARGNQLNEAPDFEAEAAKLSEYLKPFRNGNVGESLPAALVAVLGGHPKMRELLEQLLQAGLRQRPEDFLAMLLGEQSDHLAESMRRIRFLIEIVKGEITEAQTLTGEKIPVHLTPEIKTLHVGDPSDLWWEYSYRNRQDTACHRLRLRWIEHPDELTDLVAVFASTIETILLKIHCNGAPQLVPRNLKGFLDDIADAGQSDLRRSQRYLMDMAEARLQELGVRSNPQFDEVLRKFNEARLARVDVDLMAVRNPSRAQKRSEDAKKLIEDARKNLLHLLEAPQEKSTRRALVDAVRRKMTDFQYGVESVALELFQNADDAVAEQREMRGTLDRQEQKFFLSLDTEQRVLEIIHWGRPINRYESASFQDGLRRGYDQDLQKMLTLNFSDKGVETENQPAIVTGRFGLGFKSVFFVSDQPEIISGRLAFDIRGGFYPIVLSPSVAEEMRDNARRLAGSRDIVPTAIRLKLPEETDMEELSRAIEKFTQAAPLLTVFSRDIRSLEVVHDTTSHIWESIEKKLTESERVNMAKVGNRRFLCFQCHIQTDLRPATVLFQLDSSGISRLAEDLTGLWITTPTAERSDLRWALNAPFKPDAGRQRLALTNPENRKIAGDVAQGWGEALIELFDETGRNWNRFAEQLGLHADASFESWWQQLWEETTQSTPVLHWKDIREGGQVLGWIAWNQSTGAMRRLVEKRDAIPSRLPGAYKTMVKLDDLRFYVTGLLAEIENGCFSQVMDWESVRRAFPKGQTAHKNIANVLKKAGISQDLERVTLERVLAEEIDSQFQVNPLVGDRIGALLNACPSVFDANGFPNMELQHLFQWMRDLKFLARDGGYHLSNELVCDRPLDGVIEKDEAFRSSFAPNSAVLSREYSESALRFFKMARVQLNAPATTLARWVSESSPEKLFDVFKYLVDGNLGQELADELEHPWLDKNKDSRAWERLQEREKNEVERKFAKDAYWPLVRVPMIPPPTEEIVIRQEMDASEAFIRISRWWSKAQNRRMAIYERKTYPPRFPGTLPWPGEEGWDEQSTPSAQSRWLLLFVHAALVPLGFNKIGRDQSFLNFLNSRNLLDIFPKSSTEPGVLLQALDQYLDSFIQNTQFHSQMRQFIAFYAVARNLEEFLESLKAAENFHDSGIAFSQVFSPKSNPALRGTGIAAPPLKGMLGMGSCQLLRELYRLGQLTNRWGFRYAFTPLLKVRRLCTQLFGTPYESQGAQSSMIIFDALEKLGHDLDLDPTFNCCFDLPFQFLAENEHLRTKVLGRPIEAESFDGDIPDPAAEMEDFLWNQ